MSEPSLQRRFSAACITDMAESDFRYTQRAKHHYARQAHDILEPAFAMLHCQFGAIGQGFCHVNRCLNVAVLFTNECSVGCHCMTRLAMRAPCRQLQRAKPGGVGLPSS